MYFNGMIPHFSNKDDQISATKLIRFQPYMVQQDVQIFQCQIKVPSPREDQNSLKLKLNMRKICTSPKTLSLFIVSIYENQISSTPSIPKYSAPAFPEV